MSLKQFIKKRHYIDVGDNVSYFEQLETPIFSRKVQHFFNEYGASELDENEIHIGNFETEVECIFGASDEPSFSLKHNIHVYSLRLPKNHVPFASLVEGDLLTLDVTSEILYLWIHDIHDEYQMRKLRKTLPKVTDSYQDFGSMLRKHPKNEVDTATAKVYTKIDGKWVLTEK